MQEQYPKLRTSLAYFGPVVGTHLGEGALGFSMGYRTRKEFRKIKSGGTRIFFFMKQRDTNDTCCEKDVSQYAQKN